jgi:8-oxo-dGTP diphosphatase
MRVAAIIIKDEKILLLRRIRDGNEYFVFPGGSLEEGETSEKAIVREVKEELGLDIKLDKLAFQIINRGIEESYFLIKEFSGTPKWQEQEKFTENNQYYPVWIDLKDAKNLKNLFPEEARKKLVALFF